MIFWILLKENLRLSTSRRNKHRILMSLVKNKRNQDMQIKTTKNIYDQIAKQEPPKPQVAPDEHDLLAKTMEHLNKAPQLTTRIK